MVFYVLANFYNFINYNSYFIFNLPLYIYVYLLHHHHHYYTTGTPALTSRGMKQKDFVEIVGFMDEAINISIDVKSKTGNRMLTFLETFVHFFIFHSKSFFGDIYLTITFRTKC